MNPDSYNDVYKNIAIFTYDIVVQLKTIENIRRQSNIVHMQHQNFLVKSH